MKNKGIIGIGLILAIVLGVAVVGGGAYYLGKNKEVKNTGNILQKNNDDQLAETNKNLTIIESKIYGYSIGYSGIENKYVYEQDNGKIVKLLPNQSNIDELEIVDSKYVMPKNVSLVGVVTFGLNDFKKFKDNTIARHTYYLKTGLKNNKSMLISVENDLDNPNYLDLSSLKIEVVNTSEESVAEIFKDQPGEIISIKEDGLNQWVLSVDLLTRNINWLPGVDSSGPFFLNQNTKIRNLKLTNQTRAYDCENNNVSNYDFIKKLQSDQNKNRYFDIDGTNISAIYEQCLP